MADHFLSKIGIAPEDFVLAGQAPVLEQHAALRDLLTERAGPEVAALFAEPLISRGNDTAPPTVSWYTELSGDPRPLASLSSGERDSVERYLGDHLRPLRALTENPDTAELALGALSVYGQDDVLVVGTRPVIVNWGLVPGGHGANVGSRPAHFDATLGRFLTLAPASAAPRRPVGAAEATGATVAAGAVAGSVRPAEAAASEGAARVVARERVISPIAWVPLLVLLLLAGGSLAWLLMPGTRIFNAWASPPAITDAATLQAARDLNDSLRARRDELQAALDGAMCRPDGVLVLPNGRTPEGVLPPAVGVAPERKATAAPDALLPNSPARVVVPDDSPSGEGSLLSHIEARTVMVLAMTGAGTVTTGSGFSVAPGMIVTNQHVIEPAQSAGGRLLVIGAGLAEPQLAEVLKVQGPLLEAGGDFALLRIEATTIPTFPVHLPGQSLKLTNVVAAGYPGDVLATDVNYRALLSGDLSAVPGLTVTDGIINTEQKMGPETNALMHSAALSGGNSGGPLIDMCGRLVGVNTFVRQGKLQNRGFALTSGDLMAFLNGTGVAPSVDSSVCEPVVLRAQAAPAAAE